MSLNNVEDLVNLNEIIIEERDREIRAIEQDVADINEIFRDLSEMVKVQGEQLDTIEEHVESTVVHTEKATKELEKAYEYGRLGATLTAGLMGAAVAGPIGLLAGIKSGVALAGLSVGSGVLSYKVSGWLY